MARCACGRLTATCTGAPIRVSVCHCTECKRLSGSAFSWNARWASADVKIDGTCGIFTRTGDAGNAIQNRFCPSCGVTLFYTVGDVPDAVSIRAGCFADGGFPAPGVSVYDPSRRVPWLDIRAEPLARFDT